MHEFTRLVLCLQNHQAVGTPDEVMEQAYQRCYEPFWAALSEFPDIAINLHISGFLLEWLQEHRPEFLDRLRQLLETGQLELLGGPMYAPVLAGIPQEDFAGQLSQHREYIHQLFGESPRGMWVPERVWEPAFTRQIVDAGFEYTLLDHLHFQHSSVEDDAATGYYLTEHEGRPLKVFRGCEHTRDQLVRADPQRIIEGLASHRQRRHRIVSVGEDGEKFGAWPGTYDRVYDQGWLRTFFAQLTAERAWLHTAKMGTVVQEVVPKAKCYLSGCSPSVKADRAVAIGRDGAVGAHDSSERDAWDDWSERQQGASAAAWRNLLLENSEAGELYGRMLEVSHRLQQVERQENADAGAETDFLECLQSARLHLYRGQANAAYWNGAASGIQMQHLRQAAYHNLIVADNKLERINETKPKWVRATVQDFDFDARQEIRLSNDRLIGYLAPSRGGHLYELDVRSIGHNLGASLTPRQELQRGLGKDAGAWPRSSNSQQAGELPGSDASDGSAHPREPLQSSFPHKSLVDHFWTPGLTLSEFRAGHGQVGDFWRGVYRSRLRESADWVELCMQRDGRVEGLSVHLNKTVRLEAGSGCLSTRYELDGLAPGTRLCLAVEFNLAGLSMESEEAYYYDSLGRQLGTLDTEHSLAAVDRIGIADEVLGMDISLESTQPAVVWAFPVQTMCGSHTGAEVVPQSCCLLPHWQILADDQGRWQTTMRLSVDTAVAQARELGSVSNERLSW